MSGAFGRLVSAMDSAMVVVTAAHAGEGDGCLVGFHSQCSIDPPRYAVWLSVANRTHDLAEGATHLAVHLLGAGDHDLAELFGGETGDDVDKLAGVAWEPGPGGAPLLARCPHRFAGRIVARHAGGDDGDHECFVLEPVETSDGRPGPLLHLSAALDIEPGHPADDER